jgi:hypothetical protein
VLQLSPALLEDALLPALRDAKLDIFFFTLTLPHTGQTTFSVELMRTSFSKDSRHSGQSNSKIGMLFHL